MPSVLLMLGLLLTTPAQLPRPTVPLPVQTALDARVARYYQDYLERLRAVYFAPGDPRATALLSTATEELSARRRAVRAEAAGAVPTAVAPPAYWAQTLAELHKTPQGVKFLDRCRRNPALETAYQRFLDAKLDQLAPTESR